MFSQLQLPQSRLSRLAKLGQLAGGIASGALSESARQLSKGHVPSMRSVLLTANNTTRLTDRLSEMRGAAMKMGQLLSMESGEVLPKELSEALARLREQAHAMPLGQVARVLEQSWGKGWEKQFRRLNFQPLAAASIGQVHEAELKDGRRLAIKIQYPGVRRSIDSDVDNVTALLRVLNLLPKTIDFEPLLQEAKRQLHAEADYRLEATYLRQFAKCIADDPRFEVPGVVDDLTTAEVLVMHYLDGEPIESLSKGPPALRNRAAASLLELSLREVLEWGVVQTDPNFANYRYDHANGRIQLLDFGATREYDGAFRAAVRSLVHAGIEGTDQDLLQAAIGLGYVGEGDPPSYQDGIVALLRMATEPARASTDYDFGRSDLARRMSDALLELRIGAGYERLPPPDVLFLHRKLGGLYLLFTRLQATVPVRQLLSPYIEPQPPAFASGGYRLAG